MPACSSVNCSKRAENNIRLFRFPANPARRSIWVQNMRRDKFFVTSNSRLCENHFEESQFENNRQDGWKKLKPNAVPTLFDAPNSPPMIDLPLGILECEASFTFRGLMAPVFTAFNKDLSVNTSLIPEYARFLAEKNVPGILVHGSTGEGPSLSVAERKIVAEAWVKAAKTTKQHIMIQVGGCPLPDVKELARHAEEIGADSILTLPELYFKAETAQDLLNYIKDVASAAPRTPILYYHIPMWSGVNINMEKFLNLSVGKIPTFHGIKYTSNDLSEGYNALKAADGRYAVFLGADTLVQPATALGFDSIIATCLNFLPDHFNGILTAVRENRIEDAKLIQEKLTASCKVITKNGAWIPTMKVAMNTISPFNVGVARPPLKNINPDQVAELQADLPQYTVL